MEEVIYAVIIAAIVWIRFDSILLALFALLCFAWFWYGLNLLTEK